MCPAKRRDRQRTETMRRLFPDDLIVHHVDGADKEHALGELLNNLVMAGRLDLSREREVRDQILNREKVASTGIGNGVAIPHCKTKWADKLGLCVGISQQGIDFDAHDGAAVHVIMLWICPPAETKQHLALMRAIAAIAKDAKDAYRLADCKDRLSLLNVLDKIEAPEKPK
jgi:mannitol/fructose-specific phosphotransferase system IIA component (Ntr-type)